MRFRKIAAAVLPAYLAAAAGVLGCSSPGGPSGAEPTVLVINPLCDIALRCRTLEIRAFVWAFPVPKAPWGLRVLGEIEGPFECVTFPPVWELVVEEVDSTGAVSTSDTLTWSPEDPEGVFLSGMDWAAAQAQIGATETFVPADAPGWTLTFTRPGRGGFPYSANLEASNACAPP
jgi:hypothetical protein